MVAVFAAAAPAGADDTAQRDAQARFEEGLGRVRADNLAGALVSFQQAYAVMHKPAVVWNLALVEEKTSHPVDALAHFREYLRVAPEADPDRVRAQKHIDGLNAATGHIDVAAPTGAAITVDRTQALGATPLADPIDVAPGHHDVEARLGTVVKSVGIDALAGQTMHADFRGMDAAGGAAGAPGATAPQADGAGAPPAGEAPPPPDAVPAQGTTLLTPRVIVAASLAGAAVVSLGTGVFMAVQSSNNASTATGYRNQNASDTCTLNPGTPTCTKWHDAVSAQNRDAVLSDVFYVAAGVFAAASVATFVLWPKAQDGTSAAKSVTMWLVPAVTPGGAAVGAVGRF